VTSTEIRDVEIEIEALQEEIEEIDRAIDEAASPRNLHLLHEQWEETLSRLRAAQRELAEARRKRMAAAWARRDAELKTALKR
jgi:transcriptional regulator of heat shock response